MLRVRVELVPHGVEAGTETLHEVFIGNDGTGYATGPHEGGIGNYVVFLDQDPRDLLASTRSDYMAYSDFPGYIGRIDGIERGPQHRATVARAALALVEVATNDNPPDKVLVSPAGERDGS